MLLDEANKNFLPRMLRYFINLSTTLILMSSITFNAAEAGERITINSPEDLQVALSKVKGGEFFSLRGGQYGSLTLNQYSKFNVKFPSSIVISSEDPQNPAIFSSISLTNTENITFDKVVFDYTFNIDDKGYTSNFSINNSNNITVANSIFDGDVAQGVSKLSDGFGYAIGLSIRNSTSVYITESEFFKFSGALRVSDSQGVNIIMNNIHDIRIDGIQMSAVNSVKIQHNYIHDFNIPPQADDHPDMIQFWTSGTKVPSGNIEISDNILNSGSGKYTQSIFMRNEVVDTGGSGDEMYYNNVNIFNNLIINAHLHGIMVGEVNGLNINNNTLIHNAPSNGAGGTAELWTPRIWISDKSNNVTVSRNIASAIDGAASRPDWNIDKNIFIQDTDPDQAGWYDDVFISARTGDPSKLTSFIYLPEGPAGPDGLGVDILRLDSIMKNGIPWSDVDTEDVTSGIPLIQITPDPYYLNRFKFDSRLSVAPVRSDKVEYTWNFGDGSDVGARVSHDFKAAGFHIVTMVMTVAGGKKIARAARVDVPSSEIIRFDSLKGGMSVAQEGEMRTVPNILLSNDGKTILVGRDGEPSTIDSSLIKNFFGSSDVDILLKFRTNKNPSPAGEILRIHQSMVLSLMETGGVEFQLFTQGSDKPFILRSAPLGLHDGQWHDLRITYDAEKTLLMLFVDGRARSQGRATGHLGPLGRWGLSLGNPFGQKSFYGEIAAFEMSANRTRFIVH